MYPTPHKLTLPLKPYTVNGYQFRQKIWRRLWLPAVHLGEDIGAAVDTPVLASGEGEVVWSKMHRGSEAARSWGGLVILGHLHRATNHAFFSIYGHLYNVHVQVGERVEAEQPLGAIAPGNSPENGWWQLPHLHFGIYTGQWTGQVLPGWWRPEERRTNLFKWKRPQEFIQQYTHE